MAELNNPVTTEAAPTAADEPAPASVAPEGRWVIRFQRRERLLHITLMASFLTLALTGIPLLFPEAPWATKLANLLGGYGVTGKLHRMAAVTLVACFLIHVARLIERVFLKREYSLLWGPDSMVPQPRDIL